MEPTRYLGFLLLLGVTLSGCRTKQEHAATTSPSASAAVQQDPGLVEQALQFEREGKLVAAISVHEKILLLNPREVRSMNAIAGLYGKLQRFEEELSWTDKAIAQDKEYAPAWLNRGNALGSLQRFDEADEAFARALELDKELSEAHMGRGVVAENRRDYAAAVRHYRAALELTPKSTDAWYSLAAALGNQGEFEEAIKAAKRVLELDPNAKDARELLTELEARRTGKKPG